MGLPRTAALGGRQRSFFECAEAADGDERAQALRHAARLERAITGPREALALLDRMDDGAVDFEQRAADYDRAIYLTDLGRFDDAKRLLEQAIAFDERFALSALTDDLLRGHTELTYVVHAYIDGLVADLGRLRKDLERDLVAAQQALDGHPSATDTGYPKWGRSEHDALLSRIKEIQQRLETARSRHGGRLTALRTELEQALGPEAQSLRVDADAWSNGFERALAQIECEQVARQREREAVAAHQRAMSPVRDALQARLDEAALRLAAEKDTEVFSWTPWISLAPDVVVRSALVKRTARRFRAGRRWLVTLNGARDDVVIERVD